MIIKMTDLFGEYDASLELLENAYIGLKIRNSRHELLELVDFRNDFIFRKEPEFRKRYMPEFRGTSLNGASLDERI